MATVTATITNLRIEGQALAFTMAVVGGEGSFGVAMMYVYDASGTEREHTDLGKIEAGQSWDALLDLPAATLNDGDYGAWVYVTSMDADGEMGAGAEQGISFLVGRHHIYPSQEHADARSIAAPPTLSPLRLEGTWIVFDMTNNEAYDIEVFHDFSIGIKDSGNNQLFTGEELLRASATQQGHYLLPDQLPDGRYFAMVTVRNQGSDLPAGAWAEIQVDGNVLTLMPATGEF